ncbi:MAG: hypothetical protein LAP13_19605 [Acidobacteriia bacterium]|nr:hypothetical protein [Terriglobia bacterium]
MSSAQAEPLPAHTLMQLEFLEALEEDWHPVSKPTRVGWLVFYGIFLVYALTNKSGYLFIDYVFLPIHEGGHLLFRWFGQTLAVLGGTILQLGVPLALAIYFVFQRQILGTAFTAFFFFENFLNVATYMADSRAQALQYVTVGNAEYAEHDWAYIFIKLGVLEHDTAIGAFVRVLGWLGMLGVVAWFGWKTRSRPQPPAKLPWLRH